MLLANEQASPHLSSGEERTQPPTRPIATTRPTLRRWMIAPLVIGAAVALAACNPIKAALGGGSEPPAQVCASPATMKEITRLITKSDADALDELGQLGTATGQLRKLVERYWSTGAASIQLTMLESVDETNQRIVCKAQFVVKALPGSRLAKSESTLLETPIAYFRQPSADGRSFIFGYEAPQDAITVLGAARMSISAGDVDPDATSMATSATSEAEQVSLGDAIADSEAGTASFDASLYPSSAACQKAAKNFDDGLQCNELQKKEDELALAKALAAAKGRLASEDGSRLEAAHLRWATNRDEECEAEASKEAAVFSAYAAINNECILTRNRAQLKALEASGQ